MPRQNPVPAILEYLPYRKRDGTTERDALTHPYFAGHGYACVRVDMRGSGDSRRRAARRVSEAGAGRRARDHGLARAAALVHRHGRHDRHLLGRLQRIAGRRAPAEGTEGGRSRSARPTTATTTTSTSWAAALLLDKFAWGSTMFAINAAPPDPTLVGDKWREMWIERLEGSRLLARGMAPAPASRRVLQARLDLRGLGRDRMPGLSGRRLGGWLFQRDLPHALAPEGPQKGLVGPWAHKYPHFAKPGPQIGFLQECLRWWDKWLKGIETGIMDEPMLRVFMQDPVEPAPWYAERPGRWAAEPSWPSSRASRRSSGRSPRVRLRVPVLARLKSSSPSARRKRLARRRANGVPTGSMPISPATSGTRGEGRFCSTRLRLNSRWKSSARRCCTSTSPRTGRMRSSP